jgi:hypothetical protein
VTGGWQERSVETETIRRQSEVIQEVVVQREGEVGEYWNWWYSGGVTTCEERKTVGTGGGRWISEVGGSLIRDRRYKKGH